MLHSPEGGI